MSYRPLLNMHLPARVIELVV